VYVDNLLIAARKPEEIIGKLQEEHKFKLKGVWPLTYHLGCDYFRDDDGTLWYGPRNYMVKLMDQYESMYGCKSKDYTSPLEKGDHPEIDTKEELDEEGIKHQEISDNDWLLTMGGVSWKV
jgi:hypothetical protein